jgi:hypothetical protein
MQLTPGSLVAAFMSLLLAAIAAPGGQARFFALRAKYAGRPFMYGVVATCDATFGPEIRARYAGPRDLTVPQRIRLPVMLKDNQDAGVAIVVPPSADGTIAIDPPSCTFFRCPPNRLDVCARFSSALPFVFAGDAGSVSGPGDDEVPQ